MIHNNLLNWLKDLKTKLKLKRHYSQIILNSNICLILYCIHTNARDTILKLDHPRGMFRLYRLG